jgi:HSP20 family protein
MEVFYMFNRKNDHALTNYNPFHEMEEWDKNFFTNPFAFFGGGLAEFKTDLKDEGEAYLLEADLPGFAKEDIHLDLNDNMLTISAERRVEQEEKDDQGKYIRRERSYGSYTRQFDVSEIKSDDIKAKYENGVLTLRMPKKDQSQLPTRRLEIE